MPIIYIRNRSQQEKIIKTSEGKTTAAEVHSIYCVRGPAPPTLFKLYVCTLILFTLVDSYGGQRRVVYAAAAV